MTYEPQFPQKHLVTHFPLPVSQSSYLFMLPFASWISTFSFSIARLAATYEPPTLRQLAQWHRWPRGLEKREPSWIVTLMLPQRQVPVMPALKEEGGWAFGSPVKDGVGLDMAGTWWRGIWVYGLRWLR